VYKLGAVERAVSRAIRLSGIFAKVSFITSGRGRDRKTPIPVYLNLVHQENGFEIAVRGACRLNLEGRQSMQPAIDIGGGGIRLELTEEQYRKRKGGR
jgi:hypothetical protein